MPLHFRHDESASVESAHLRSETPSLFDVDRRPIGNLFGPRTTFLDGCGGTYCECAGRHDRVVQDHGVRCNDCASVDDRAMQDDRTR